MLLLLRNLTLSARLYAMTERVIGIRKGSWKEVERIRKLRQGDKEFKRSLGSVVKPHPEIDKY